MMRPIALAAALVLAAPVMAQERATALFASPDTQWQLVELRGEAFSGVSTLSFPEPNRIAGLALCNRFSGTAEWKDDALVIGPLAMTMMACPEGDEFVITSALSSVASGTVTGDLLNLTLEGGGTMVYARPVSPFTQPDVTWHLAELGGLPFDGDATLVFGAEGAVSGRAVCNRFSGTATWSEGALALGPLAMTRMACPDMEAEQSITEALSAVTSGGIVGERLFLGLADGGRLIYRPSASGG